MAKTIGSKNKSIARSSRSGRFVTTLNEGYVRKGGVNSTSKIKVRPAAASGISPSSARPASKKK